MLRFDLLAGVEELLVAPLLAGIHGALDSTPQDPAAMLLALAEFRANARTWSPAALRLRDAFDLYRQVENPHIWARLQGNADTFNTIRKDVNGSAAKLRAFRGLLEQGTQAEDNETHSEGDRSSALPERSYLHVLIPDEESDRPHTVAEVAAALHALDDLYRIAGKATGKEPSPLELVAVDSGSAILLILGGLTALLHAVSKVIEAVEKLRAQDARETSERFERLRNGVPLLVSLREAEKNTVLSREEAAQYRERVLADVDVLMVQGVHTVEQRAEAVDKKQLPPRPIRHALESGAQPPGETGEPQVT